MVAGVFDNLFDMKFMAKVEFQLMHLPVTAINVANGTAYPSGDFGTHKLMGECIFERHSINKVVNLMEDSEVFFEMFDHIEDHLEEKFYLQRIDFNLQHSFCDGTSHVDGDEGEYTIMYMPNMVWDTQEWGGQFQLLDDDDNVIEEHEYVPGRTLIFPSEISHRGLGPRHPHVYRYTVVWRVKKLADIL
jgi:hypothetical protein